MEDFTVALEYWKYIKEEGGEKIENDDESREKKIRAAFEAFFNFPNEL